MKEIYLLANNPNTQFPLKELNNSIVCHFNKAIFRKQVNDTNTHYLMVNSFTKSDGNGGYFTPDEKSLYNNHYFVCSWTKQFNSDPWKKIREDFIPHTLVITYQYGDDYPKGKFRSVGYSALKYFDSTFEKINLVGFTFSGWNGHDWEFEKEYAINNKKVNIIL